MKRRRPHEWSTEINSKRKEFLTNINGEYTHRIFPTDDRIEKEFGAAVLREWQERPLAKGSAELPIATFIQKAVGKDIRGQHNSSSGQTACSQHALCVRKECRKISQKKNSRPGRDNWTCCWQHALFSSRQRANRKKWSHNSSENCRRSSLTNYERWICFRQKH